MTIIFLYVFVASIDAIRQSRCHRDDERLPTYSEDCGDFHWDSPFGMDAYPPASPLHHENSRESSSSGNKELLPKIRLINGPYRYQKAVWLWGLLSCCRLPPQAVTTSHGVTQPALCKSVNQAGFLSCQTRQTLSLPPPYNICAQPNPFPL